MCDFSASKVLHIFPLSLCLCCVLGKHEWVDIYKRCRARQNLGGWGVFWWVHVGCEDQLFSWNCLFLYWTFTRIYSALFISPLSSYTFFFFPLNSANGASHEEQELQFDLPPAAGVNPAGLHPAGLWEDCKGAGHEYDLCWLHRRDSLYKRYHTITPKFYTCSNAWDHRVLVFFFLASWEVLLTWGTVYILHIWMEHIADTVKVYSGFFRSNKILHFLARKY